MIYDNFLAKHPSFLSGSVNLSTYCHRAWTSSYQPQQKVRLGCCPAPPIRWEVLRQLEAACTSHRHWWPCDTSKKFLQKLCGGKIFHWFYLVVHESAERVFVTHRYVVDGCWGTHTTRARQKPGTFLFLQCRRATALYEMSVACNSKSWRFQRRSCVATSGSACESYLFR